MTLIIYHVCDWCGQVITADQGRFEIRLRQDGGVDFHAPECLKAWLMETGIDIEPFESYVYHFELEELGP